MLLLIFSFKEIFYVVCICAVLIDIICNESNIVDLIVQFPLCFILFDIPIEINGHYFIIIYKFLSLIFDNNIS